MLRMIIADDERAIREAIRDAIDWQALGITVIGLCRNGAEALDMALDEYPDIMLTDIKMPGLTGLELISRVVQARLDTEFVILSGYGEFDLAREAMRWGVKHYLLKPASTAQITATMQEVVGACYRRRAAASAARAETLVPAVRGLLAETLGSAQPIETIAARWQPYIDLDRSDWELCTVRGIAAGSQELTLAALTDTFRWQAGGVPLYALDAGSELLLLWERFDAGMASLDAEMRSSLASLQAGATLSRESHSCLRALLAHLHALAAKGAALSLHGDAPIQAAPPAQTDAVQAVLDEMAANLADPCLSLKPLAEERLRMDVNELSRRFASQTGERFSACLTRLRVERARILLTQPGASLTGAAQQVGYGDHPQYFSQLFRRSEGMTPNEYMHAKGNS